MLLLGRLLILRSRGHVARMATVCTVGYRHLSSRSLRSGRVRLGLVTCAGWGNTIIVCGSWSFNLTNNNRNT
jgi:hypothetical protein